MKRRAEILERREKGATIRSIARAMRIDSSTVHSHLCGQLREWLEKHQETAAEIVALERAQLHYMQERLAPKVAARDEKAINTTLKIMHMHNRLCGLYPDTGVPSQHLHFHHQPVAGQPDVTLRPEIRVTFHDGLPQNQESEADKEVGRISRVIGHTEGRC